MGIGDRVELQEHLQWAMAIEMLTIPAYLYALYSIKDPGTTSARLIRSIVAEEMLHLALASNVLLAVGGEPRFYDPSFPPSYPVALPHHTPELVVNLEPCSPRVVEDVFMLIEQPKDLTSDAPDDGEYHSLGDFYGEIEDAVHSLEGGGDLFAHPQLDRQLTDPSFYQPVEFDAEDSGGLHAVTDAETACRAIETILHQGEGLRDHHWADPSHQELTHYYKLREIARGMAPIGDLWPLRTNPRLEDYPEQAAAAARLFNAAYGLIFITLDDLAVPATNQARGALISRLYSLMADVLPPVARALVATPLGDGSHAGPTFEFYEFDEPNSPLSELHGLAEMAAQHIDELSELPSILNRL